MENNDTILEIKGLSKHFSIEKGVFKKVSGIMKAVDRVSFNIKKGEILGLVGESGSGKTTTGRMIAGLIKPTEGSILFKSRDISGIKRKELGLGIQLIFQNPFASLNPKLSVGTIIGEAVKMRQRTENGDLKTTSINKRIIKILDTVGLPANILNDYPHQFSGGQRQRIGIARALAMEPELIIADEPVSSLDISIQAQILNLLADLRDAYGLSYLFITHDLNVVKHLCERVIVMYKGEIVEEAMTERIYSNPGHKYTRKLLSSIPQLP